jgi:hypothetical protein
MAARQSLDATRSAAKCRWRARQATPIGVVAGSNRCVKLEATCPIILSVHLEYALRQI